jgi:putative selenium metabolism hydrolase
MLMLEIRDALDTPRLIAFTKKLIQTPSLSLEEEVISSIIREEMLSLGYDEVHGDALGNVVGVLKGRGAGPTLMMNGHMDHAGVGEMEEPFSGKEIDGGPFGHEGPVIYGRGACDMKGALASMIHAGGVIKKMGSPLRGDVLVTCVVREEMARGEGILHLLASGWKADYALSGEASALNLRVGHRGKMELMVTTKGRTSHAGYPQGGINAVIKMNNFINALQEKYPLPEHPFLGKADCTVIDIKASPGALTPIVPDRCELNLDRRFFPEESEAELLGGFRVILEELQSHDPDFRFEIETLKWFPSMFTDPESPIVQAMLKAREKVMGDPGKIGAWYFGVDGTFINQAGIPCVGFGPGNEYLAHTPKDVVPVDHVITACRVYAQLISDLCA